MVDGSLIDDYFALLLPAKEGQPRATADEVRNALDSIKPLDWTIQKKANEWDVTDRLRKLDFMLKVHERQYERQSMRDSTRGSTIIFIVVYVKRMDIDSDGFLSELETAELLRSHGQSQPLTMDNATIRLSLSHALLVCLTRCLCRTLCYARFLSQPVIPVGTCSFARNFKSLRAPCCYKNPHLSL